MRVELDARACVMAAAPISPISLHDRSNTVRVKLDLSACAMDDAPVGPI